MYGDKITTQYGREGGRRRSVVGKVGTAPIGNLTLHVGRLYAPEGKTEPSGCEITEYPVLRPSEAIALVAEIIETTFGHEGNVELLGRTTSELSDVNENGLCGQLKNLADELELAEKELGRAEEVDPDA